MHRAIFAYIIFGGQNTTIEVTEVVEAELIVFSGRWPPPSITLSHGRHHINSTASQRVGLYALFVTKTSHLFTFYPILCTRIYHNHTGCRLLSALFLGEEVNAKHLHADYLFIKYFFCETAQEKSAVNGRHGRGP